MPLKLVGGEAAKYFEPKFDIIAVPAIGGDPVQTFTLPGYHGPSPPTLWTELHEARVYVFSYNRRDSKHEGITTYAVDLLQNVKSEVIDLGRRPIHFAAFSTGGLVVKRALVLALGGFDKGRFLDITRCCFSLAFFGTPHYGSNFLGGPAYKEGVKELFGLTHPYSGRLRAEIRNPENLDEMRDFNLRFIPYTLTLSNIWTFIALKETVLPVKISEEGKEGSTVLRVPVVDARSSSLSKQNLEIGCERLKHVPTDHMNLPQFGNEPTAPAFAEYIQELTRAVDTAVADKVQDIYGLDQRIKAEVHLFYDFTENKEEYVKLWSVAPSLMTLFAFGPAKCLEQRKDSAKENLATPSPTTPTSPPTKHRRRAGTVEHGSTTSSPILKQTPSESNGDSGDAESETSSTVTYQLPDIDQPKFRWIHVPATNMFWMEKVIQAVELEREEHRLEIAKQRVEKVSEEAPEAPTPESYAKTTKQLIKDPGRATLDPLASHLQKALEGIKAKGEEPPVENIVEAFKDPKKAVQLLTATLTDKIERTPLNLAETALLVEDYGEKARALEAAIPNEEGQPLNYFNDMREGVKDEKGRSKLGATLLNKRVWNSKQIEARHGYPHGRYMDPYCEIFFPKAASLARHGHTAPLASPGDFPQMCLYFPYLHWDTFGSVKTRNKLVKARMEVQSSAQSPIPEEPVRQLSLEHMMIWQHINSSANLPLHIRRTLDQYGYYTLEDTTKRDADQVIYKCARAHRQNRLQKAADQQQIPRRRFWWSAARGRTLPAQVPYDDDDDETKVLMVDELWCSVIDPLTVTTFFNAKEEPLSSSEMADVQDDMRKQKEDTERLLNKTSPSQSSADVRRTSCPTETFAAARTPGMPDDECREAPVKRIFSQADLRNAIHADVNGDLEFATPCHDCFDFAALAVYHAVTVFLAKDSIIDRNLHVFDIFREVICYKVEHHTRSFQNFKENQNGVSLVSGLGAGARGSASSEVTDQSIEETANTLDNSEDLSALWDLLDIEDELSMLEGLFEKQKRVIEKMMSEYKKLDEYLASVSTAPKRKHEQALSWLEESRDKVDEYLEDVKSLNKSRKSAQESLIELLDMKQKQANAIEAYSARRANQVAAKQNRSIMIFTVFTIIFLPLSFFTSLFGMNVRDWNGQASNESLGNVFIVMFCVSICLILLTMLFAFTGYPQVIIVYLRSRHWPWSHNGEETERGVRDLDEEQEEAADRGSTPHAQQSRGWYRPLKPFSRNRRSRAEQSANEKQPSMA